MVLILFLAFICYLPVINNFIPATRFGAGIPEIGAVRAGFYLLFLAFILHVAILRRIRLSKWISNLAIFYIIVSISVLWSNYSYGSTATIQQIFNTIFIPFTIALIAFDLFSKKNNKNHYIMHISITSCILSIMSCFQAIGAILTHQEIFRARGVFENPNTLAIFLVLTLPCIIQARENRLIPPIIGRMVLFTAFIGIMSTVSRKGIAMMLLSFCLFNYLKKNFKQIAAFLIVFSILGGIFLGLKFFSQRFEENAIQRQFTNKWNMTIAGIKMFQSSPVIGLGYKGYYENYGKYYPNAWTEKYDAHNIFITALANYGMLGFIPFMGIFLYPLFLCIRTIRRKQSPIATESSRDMAIVCICSIIPFMGMGWFSGGLFYSAIEVSLLYSNISLFMANQN